MKTTRVKYIIIVPEILPDYKIQWKTAEVLGWVAADFPELIIYEKGGFHIAHRKSGLVISICMTLGEAKNKMQSAQNKLEAYKKAHWDTLTGEEIFRNDILNENRQGE